MMIDQILRAADEVIDGVLLAELSTRLVPCLTALAAAANVRNRQDAAALQPRQRTDIKRRLDRDAVGAIGGQQRRIRAIERQFATMQDRQWDRGRAISGRYRHFFRRNHRHVDRATRLQSGVGELSRLRCERIDQSRRRPALQLQRKAGAAVVGADARDAAADRQRQLFRLRCALIGHSRHNTETVAKTVDIQRVPRHLQSGATGGRQHQRAFGQLDLRVTEVFPGDIETDDAAVADAVAGAALGHDEQAAAVRVDRQRTIVVSDYEDPRATGATPYPVGRRLDDAGDLRCQQQLRAGHHVDVHLTVLRQRRIPGDVGTDILQRRGLRRRRPCAGRHACCRTWSMPARREPVPAAAKNRSCGCRRSMTARPAGHGDIVASPSSRARRTSITCSTEFSEPPSDTPTATYRPLGEGTK